METVQLVKPRRHLVVRGLWRYFVTGRPLWGKGDNATFLLDATTDYRGGPVERLSRARWRRVARRHAGVTAPLCLLAWDWRAAALYALLALVGVGGWLGYLVALWWPQRAVRRTYVYPAARVLAKVTGQKFRRRAALRDILLPAGYGEEPTEIPVVVFLPDIPLDAGTKRRVVEALGPRLGLPDATARWIEVGERIRVELLPQLLPPVSVRLADLMDELLAAPLAQPVVGVQGKGHVIHMDFNNDSPHTLGSAGSGAGKSTLYKFVAMQRLRHPNTYAIMLDFKKWSHLRWMGRLEPGRVLIEDEVPRIHEVLCRVLDELLWRKSFNLDQERELEALPTVDVYVEEINTLMSLLQEYWKAEVARRKSEARAMLRRAKDSEDEGLIEEAEEALAAANGLSATSPAIQALRYGVNLGREFRIHFHLIGQSMSAKAAGGRDTRESFRTRLLARWDAKTWKMLADGVPFIACPAGPTGIWAHVHGAEVEIVRVPFVADADAVAYVQGGPRPSLPMFHGDAIVAEVRPALDASASLRDLVPMLPAPGLGIDALRKAAQRPGFPAPVGTVVRGVAAEYSVAEVLAWFADRERMAIDAA
jgi:hypothetical protein